MRLSLCSTTQLMQATAKGICCHLGFQQNGKLLQKSKEKKTKSDMDVWVDIIYQHRALCWHALSLAIADILRVHALHVCLNKKADKEYLSVSSIWSPRLFESIWVYLAGHADSLWTIYHRKKTPEVGTVPVSCLFFPPPSPLSPPGYWCSTKTKPQFTWQQNIFI